MNARQEMKNLLEALEKIQAAYNAHPNCDYHIREAIDESRAASTQAREELEADEVD